jgi:hypothetical protein
MGMFRDMKEAFQVLKSDELKEMKKKADAQPRVGMMEGVKMANEAMDQAQTLQQQAGGMMDMSTGTLYSTGLQGSATVESLHDTGTFINNSPVMDIEMMVTVPGKEPYKVTHRQLVSHAALGNFQPGKTFSVRVDQNDPQKLVIG